MAEVVYLTGVRLSFPKLIEAASGVEGAAKKFSADLIIKPGDPQFAKFMTEVGKMATDKWKEHAPAVMQMVQADRKLRCFGMGNEKIDKKTYKPYNGYQDMMYLSTNSNEDRPPQIMRPADGKVAANAIERMELARQLYGGCFVNVAVRPWVQDNQFGRAIRCELVAVQFASDGEPFGEAAPDLSMFKAVSAAQTPAQAPFPPPEQSFPAFGAPAAPIPFPSFLQK